MIYDSLFFLTDMNNSLLAAYFSIDDLYGYPNIIYAAAQLLITMKKICSVMASTTAVLFILYPGIVSTAVRDSIVTSVEKVIPSLFSFMVISRLMLGFDAAGLVYPLLKPLSDLMCFSREEFSAFVTGNLCGFPSGAYAVSEVLKECDRDETGNVALAAVSNNVSSGFVLSFVGGTLLGSVRHGVIIYLSQLTASIMIAAYLRRRKERENFLTGSNNIGTVNVAESFCKAVADSSRACVNLIGFISFFSVLSVFITEISCKIGLPDTALSIIKVILEITSGCESIQTGSYVTKIAMISFACGFSGLCVIFQSAPYLYKAGVKLNKYVLIKSAQGLLSSLFSVAAIKLIYNT